MIKINSFEIFEQDTKDRDQIARIFYPQDQTPNVGLIQLKQAYIFAAVLEQNGHPINQHKLDNETQRIEASSRDRNTLKRIQSIFKDSSGKMDLERYQKVFVLPTYVERIIGASFFQSLPLHQETHQKALNLHAEAFKNPKNLYALARQQKLEHGMWCLSKTEGVRFLPANEKLKKVADGKAPKLIDQSRDSAPNAEIRNEIEAQWAQAEKEWTERWFREIITPTPLLSLVGPVIDYSDQWMVMRLMKKNKDQACFETVIVPKVAFDQWLEQEKSKVKIIEYARAK